MHQRTYISRIAFEVMNPINSHFYSLVLFISLNFIYDSPSINTINKSSLNAVPPQKKYPTRLSRPLNTQPSPSPLHFARIHLRSISKLYIHTAAHAARHTQHSRIDANSTRKAKARQAMPNQSYILASAYCTAHHIPAPACVHLPPSRCIMQIRR